MIPIRRIPYIGLCAVLLILDGCSLGGLGGPYPGVPELVPLSSVPRYSGPAEPPRVLYRIDKDRYFEDASHPGHFCENGSPIYYVDKALGIRSFVVLTDAASARAPFTIDASNDQYLIGPVTRGNTDCSSGGGGCGGERMPYSVDAGRTWKRAAAFSASAPISISGSMVFAIDSFDITNFLDLTNDVLSLKNWHSMPNNLIHPGPRKSPIDKKFHCTENGK